MNPSRVFILLLLTAQIIFAQSQAISNDAKYLPNELILKLKDDVDMGVQYRSRSKGVTQSTSQKDIGALLGIADKVDSAELLFSEEFVEQSISLSRARSSATNQTKTTNVNSGSLKNIYHIVLKGDNIDLTTLIEELSQRTDVEYVEPNYLFSIDQNFEIKEIENKPQQAVSSSPNDTYYGDLDNIRQANIDKVWENGTTGAPSQIVAIIDTGIDYNHPDLAANMWVNPGEIAGNGIDDDGNGFVDDVYGYDFINNDGDPMEDNFHGTHVAGTVGAIGNNGVGVVGAVWDVQLMAVKVLGASGIGATSAVVRGVEYAFDNGATVQNMSLGSSFDSEALRVALLAAASTSVLVGAAGNSNNCIGPETCSDGSTPVPSYPGAYAFVIGVEDANGTYDNYDQDGPLFSGYTSLLNYEVAAAGSRILSTYPGNRYAELTGTSMATPLVAGAIALYKEINPEASVDEIFGTFINTSGPAGIDLDAALRSTPVPKPIILSAEINDNTEGNNRDGQFDPGEIVNIIPLIKNYWSAANTIRIGIEYKNATDAQYVEITTAQQELETLSSYGELIRPNNPLKIKLLEVLPSDYDLSFIVSVWDGDNKDFLSSREIKLTTSSDIVAPVITLIGDPEVITEVGQPYNDSGATALDNFDGDISSRIVTIDSVNNKLLGTYTVTYNVTDSSGNQAVPVVREVTVTDTTAPIITLNGKSYEYLILGGTYIEKGAVAIDNYDGDISSDISIASTVNPNILGLYTVTYTVSDSSGNSAVVVRDVDVRVPDVTAPVITLIGEELREVKVGAAFIDPGATALDDYDGDLTSEISVINSVNTNVIGSYTVTYSVSDLAGNTSTITRIVNVTDEIDLKAQVNEDTEIQISLSPSNATQNTLIFTAENPNHGSIEMLRTSLIYRPNQNYNGQDTITFSANDGNYDLLTGTIAITILPINDSPVFAMPESIDVSEGTPVNTRLIELSATDIDIDPLSFSLEDNPDDLFTIKDGYLVLNQELDYETSTTHTITLVVDDGKLEDRLSFTINVIDVANNFIDQDYKITVYDVKAEGAVKSFDISTWTQTIEGVNSEELVYEITGGADQNWFTIDSATGLVNFKQAPDFENPNDSNKDNTYNITIRITNRSDGGNSVPVTLNQFNYAAPEGQTVAFKIDASSTPNGTDSDGDGIEDTTDNCPANFNPGQEDFDGDGVGDVCDDSDLDSFFDNNDKCPESRYGITTDASGCEYFTLPKNAFSVSSVSYNCPGSSNGSITISPKDTNYSYRFSVNDEPSKVLNNPQTIANLPAGVHKVCLTVNGVSNFETCYTIEITEAEPLSANSIVNFDTRTIELELKGSTEYTVSVNNTKTRTKEDNIRFNLRPGLNRIEVSTDLDCQGVYFEEIFVSEEVKVYPNPTSGPLQLFVTGEDKLIELSITTLNGVVLKSQSLSVPNNRIVETNLDALPQGMYIVKLSGKTVKTHHKIIKE